MNYHFMHKLSGFILVLVTLTGCKDNNQNPGWSQAPVEVSVAIIKPSKTVINKEYTASIEGVTNVEIRPQISGYLQKIMVDEGAYVHQGDALFLIEKSVYQEQYHNAQANLTTAKIDLDRKKELVKSNIISNLQVEEAEAVYNAAQAQAASAKINLDFCTVTAPVSGYISRIPYRLGSLVAPNNPEPLTFLTDIERVHAYFSLSEGDFLVFQQQYGGQTAKETFENIPPVSLVLSNGASYGRKGKIDAIDGRFNKTTGAITLRAQFENPTSMLRSGNTGKVVIEQHYDNALLIPIASTIQLQDKVFIFSVDKDNKAIQYPIEVLGKSGTNYIVGSGLKSGDKYIVSGFAQLQPGTPVLAQKEAANNPQ